MPGRGILLVAIALRAAIITTLVDMHSITPRIHLSHFVMSTFHVLSCTTCALNSRADISSAIHPESSRFFYLPSLSHSLSLGRSFSEDVHSIQHTPSDGLSREAFERRCLAARYFMSTPSSSQREAASHMVVIMTVGPGVN
ncbi:uncharacterized protein BKA78DRAFT_28123 [Phyllosticta capitalensis]|uniref:uncharacterized protein n=1 Tax=Phyllosticta capitalensis TaxID=121624 RepID=UPI00312FFCBA